MMVHIVREPMHKTSAKLRVTLPLSDKLFSGSKCSALYYRLLVFSRHELEFQRQSISIKFLISYPVRYLLWGISKCSVIQDATDQPKSHPCAITPSQPALHTNTLLPLNTKYLDNSRSSQINLADQTPLISILSARFPSMCRKNLNCESQPREAISAPTASLGAHDKSR